MMKAAMSDDWLILIPTDPQWIPTEAQQAAARVVLERLCPNAERRDVAASDTISFRDAGANFSAIRCPNCGAQIDRDWWLARMDDANSNSFTDLSVVTPCCGTNTTLNDLEYDWPQGFSIWALEAMNPGRGRLTEDELRAFATALGHSVREIWTHI